jgi:hypothetical protein
LHTRYADVIDQLYTTLEAGYALNRQLATVLTVATAVATVNRRRM